MSEYGVVGLAAGAALVARRPSSVWLAAAAIAGGVIWNAWLSTRGQGPAKLGDSVRVLMLALLLLASGVGPGACRQLYSGPPVVTDRDDRDGLVTKRVRAKREPDRLIAEDLSVCWVIPEVFASVRPGDHWRCAWRHIPRGQ